jgi:large subunit ribosomal protein L35
MPKLKTKKSLAKRLGRTAKGRFKRASAYKGHILTKKSRSRKRRLRRGALVHKHQEAIFRKLMPYS